MRDILGVHDSDGKTPIGIGVKNFKDKQFQMVDCKKCESEYTSAKERASKAIEHILSTAYTYSANHLGEYPNTWPTACHGSCADKNIKGFKVLRTPPEIRNSSEDFAAFAAHVVNVTSLHRCFGDYCCKKKVVNTANTRHELEQLGAEDIVEIQSCAAAGGGATYFKGWVRCCRFGFGIYNPKTGQSIGRQPCDVPRIIVDQRSGLRFECARNNRRLVGGPRVARDTWNANIDVSLLLLPSQAENSIEEITLLSMANMIGLTREGMVSSVERYVTEYASKHETTDSADNNHVLSKLHEADPAKSGKSLAFSVLREVLGGRMNCRAEMMYIGTGSPLLSSSAEFASACTNKTKVGGGGPGMELLTLPYVKNTPGA